MRETLAVASAPAARSIDRTLAAIGPSSGLLTRCLSSVSAAGGWVDLPALA
ncbi:MAG TPA: hypothetical protein VF163_02600 [Micromonosporaceae bacterium]